MNADIEHIACSSSTQSEVVVPIVSQEGRLLAVLDIDSDVADAFEQADIDGLLEVSKLLAARYVGCHAQVQ